MEKLFKISCEIEMSYKYPGDEDRVRKDIIYAIQREKPHWEINNLEVRVMPDVDRTKGT